jgi:hypothetical protein
MNPLIRIRIQKGDLIPAMLAVGQLMGSAEQKTINTMAVEHDDECAIFLAVKRHGYEESVCNCAPDLLIQTHTDNATLVPAMMAILKQYRQEFPAQA